MAVQRSDPVRGAGDLLPASGWEEFHRLAELLDALGQIQLPETVVKAAAASPDEDIRDVAEDYS